VIDDTYTVDILDVETHLLFFYKNNQTGDIDVKHSHQYYYQIQTQTFVRDVQYCDFVVCTFPREQAEIVKRVYRDTELMEKCVKSANQFFRNCVLPELLGRD